MGDPDHHNLLLVVGLVSNNSCRSTPLVLLQSRKPLHSQIIASLTDSSKFSLFTKGLVHGPSEPKVGVGLEEGLLSSQPSSLRLGEVCGGTDVIATRVEEVSRQRCSLHGRSSSHPLIRRVPVDEGHVVDLGRNVHKSLLEVVEAARALLLRVHLDGTGNYLALALDST